MAPTAADIPNKYDVIIDGVGYVFADAADVDVGAYSLAKAIYQFSPTFVTRQNVQGDYGDNQQDFWLTLSQNDWSLGQQQRYFRQDAASKRRFWKGEGINVREPGQVTIRQDVLQLSALAGNVKAAVATRGYVWVATNTNLYEIAADGTLTDRGAHGAGNIGLFSMAADLTYLYIAGATKVRKYAIAVPAFSDFSASLADSLAFLNNTLYGYRQTTGDLVSWDSAGTITTGLATWKGATGVVYPQVVKLLPFGGKLLILRVGENWESQLWSYDGTGVSMLAAFPPTFSPHDLCAIAGTLFISGLFSRTDGTYKPVLYYYTQSGQMNVLWQGYDWATSIGAPGICPLEDGLAFVDSQQNKLMFFDPTLGGVHPIANLVGSNFAILLTGTATTIVCTRSDTSVQIFPGSTTNIAVAQIDLSLGDFDSSLNKYFKGVKVDADVPAGASFDIAYRLNDVDGSYTTLQSGLTAGGTEYAINQSGRSISIRIRLNRGATASGTGPKLKRVYLRAVPVQASFKRREYVLDLTGRDGEQMRQDRNAIGLAADGMAQAQVLFASAVKTTPIVLIDRFGTYNGIIDLENSRVHELRPEEFYARVVVRETG